MTGRDEVIEAAITRISDVIASLQASEPGDEEEVTTAIINDAVSQLSGVRRDLAEAHAAVSRPETDA